ncbi:MAG: EAL domain-containing protein [Gammaproteobacteria bacterium]|nr:EAL domain-containing protein [Gammaproteobacteria bacterium]
MLSSKKKKLWSMGRIYTIALVVGLGMSLVIGIGINHTFVSQQQTETTIHHQVQQTLQQTNFALNKLLPYELAVNQLSSAIYNYHFQLESQSPDQKSISEASQNVSTQLTLAYQQLRQTDSSAINPKLRAQIAAGTESLIALHNRLGEAKTPAEQQRLYLQVSTQIHQIEHLFNQSALFLRVQNNELRQRLLANNNQTINQLQQLNTDESNLITIFIVLLIALPLLITLAIAYILDQRLRWLIKYANAITNDSSTPVPFRANDRLGLLAMALYRLGRQVKRHINQVVEQTVHVENARVVAEKMANYDPLTALPNRRHFTQLLEKQLQNNNDDANSRYLMFLDLDNFKPINDFYGHDAGDRLLRIIAARLANLLRPDDVIARLGGDEFAMIIRCDTAQVDSIAQKILNHIAQPIALNDKRIDISISVGIALMNEESTVSKLLKQADMAMYQAKALGKNNFSFYSPELETEVLHHQRLLNDAKHGLANNEFVLYYQPKIDLKTLKPIGCEALIRWQHHEKGLLLPGAFLPQLENSAFMLEIEGWVLRTACEQASYWINLGHPISLAVNVTIKQFFAENFVSMVQQILRDTGFPPHMLELEITETMLMDDIKRGEQILAALREQNISVAVDDFGTGYSSLGYLHDLPLDCLKLDRRFVSAITPGHDPSIIDAIISLGHRLNLKIVAEGIETDAQLRSLQQLGCDVGQGYLFSPALPYNEFLQYINLPRAKLISLSRTAR